MWQTAIQKEPKHGKQLYKNATNSNTKTAIQKQRYENNDTKTAIRKQRYENNEMETKAAIRKQRDENSDT